MHVITIPIEEAFQALSDTTRLRMVRLLAVTGEEVCLCELVDSLREPQYKLSRHMKSLRNAGIIDCKKEGRWVYHRLIQEPGYLRALIDVIRSLPDTDGGYAADLARFEERLAYREDGRCCVGVLTASLKTEAG